MSRQFRIAMVAACPFPANRGTPVRIYRLAEALARRGHELHLVTYHLGVTPPDAPFQVHRIPNLRTYRKIEPGPAVQKLALVDPLLMLKLNEVLRRHDIDLIHAHHYEGLLVSLLARPWRRPLLVYDAHTMLESELPHYGAGLTRHLKRIVGRAIDHALPQHADYLIAVTEEIRQRVVERKTLPPERVAVVSSGVEWEHFAPVGKQPPVAENSLRRLVYSGNLASYQGFDLLLRAFRHVLDQRPNVRLRIASNSSLAPYQSLLRQLALGAHIEQVPGDFVSLPAQLAGSDVAANPRVACDGVPQKLLNYMAAAAPIVSFAGSAGILEHNHTGLVVPNNDTTAFAQAVLQLLDNVPLAQRLGANARQHVRNTYSWERAAALTEDVYNWLWDQHATQATQRSLAR